MTPDGKPSIKLTDRLLFCAWLTVEAKLVLGATLDYPNRDPSLSQLTDALPMKRETIAAAQDELEAAGVATYDRPAKWFDRNPNDPRFNRSNKLTEVADFANPAAPMNTGAWTELPGQIVARLPRGQKNAKLFPLAALLFVREQLQRRAIQLHDGVLREMLGVSQKQVRRLRDALLVSGIVLDHGDGIETIPCGTAFEPEPAALDPSKTRRIVPLYIHADLTITVHANPAERQALAARIAKLGGERASWALLAAVYDARNHARTGNDALNGPAALDALAKVPEYGPFSLKVDDPPRLSFYVYYDDGVEEPSQGADTECPSGNLQAPLGEPTAAVGGTGLLPPTSYPENQAASPPSHQNDRVQSVIETFEQTSGPSASSEENPAGEEETRPLDDLPDTTSALRELLGGQIPHAVRSDLAISWKTYGYVNGGEPLTREQLRLIDGFLWQRLQEEPHQRDRSGLIRFARNVVGVQLRMADELHEEVKALRPALDGPDYSDLLGTAAE